MGQCTSKNTNENGVYNQMRKSDRQLRTGVKFKDIEFVGFIGFSTVVNDVYTPSGVEATHRVEVSEARQTVKVNKADKIDKADKAVEVVKAVEVDE